MIRLSADYAATKLIKKILYTQPYTPLKNGVAIGENKFKIIINVINIFKLFNILIKINHLFLLIKIKINHV